MTTTLERPAPAPAPTPSIAPASRLARWWSGWRVALRLARRDAWRSKGRSLLVVLLIALPVAVVTGVYVLAIVSQQQFGDRGRIHALVGDTADAWIQPVGGAVYQAPNGNLGSPDGTVLEVGGDSDPGKASTKPPTVQQLLAALPAGTRLVPDGTGNVNATIEDGAWGVASALSVADVRDPLVAGRWTVVSGSFPAAQDEIALGAGTARRMHASIGDTVTVTDLDRHRATRLRVVGLVRPVSSAWGSDGGVALPGALPGVTTNDQGYLAAVPRPLTWADVRAVNKVGGSVQSLQILDSPPAFCRVDQICFDDHGAVGIDEGQPLSSEAAAEIARKAAEGAVIVVLVVLQIALLAGPAFAVQLRRRQRELGLVSASGGSVAVLRRTMLASGVVLGLVGAATGLLVGWGAIWLLGGVQPWWSPVADSVGTRIGLPPFPPELLAFALVGAISAVAAAAVPAVMAGRGDVIDALKGQRPLPPVRRRTPLVGVLMAAAGLGVTAYGTAQTDPLVLGVGVIIGELGLVLLMPWLVVQLGRPAARLPVSLRIAVRDSGRHRMRTAAAACAVMAAAAAAVAASTWALSASADRGNSDRNLPDGVVLVQVTPQTDSNGIVTRPVGDAVATATRIVGEVAPGATSVVQQLVPASAKAGGTTQCVSWPGWTSQKVSPSGVALDQPCRGRTVAGPSFLTGVLVVDDVDRLDQLLGPLAPLDAAKAALRAGKALVLTPHTLDPQGRVWIQAQPYDDSPLPTPVSLPGFEVLSGAYPAQVIVGPDALGAAPLKGVLAPDPSTAYLLVAPSTGDSPDRPSAEDRLTLALVKGGVNGGVLDAGVVVDPVLLTLAIGAAATVLLALLAGLMVTALALADGRADLQTLAAVGGPPRVRRRFAAASAGFVTGLGCLVGAVSGLAVAWVLLPLLSDANAYGELTRGPFAVPWASLGIVVVAVPLITALVAGATTRSRIALTRRPD
jgi:putative ABC transport system permease protein